MAYRDIATTKGSAIWHFTLSTMLHLERAAYDVIVRENCDELNWLYTRLPKCLRKQYRKFCRDMLPVTYDTKVHKFKCPSYKLVYFATKELCLVFGDDYAIIPIDMRKEIADATIEKWCDISWLTYKE